MNERECAGACPTTDPELASLRGAAVLSLAALEAAPTREIAASSSISETLEPQPELGERYDELYAASLGYYENNRRWLARLNRDGTET